jgi:hypothetical protein
MNPITVLLNEEKGIKRVGELIKIGVPLPQNELINTNNLYFENLTTGKQTPCQSAPTAHWPDGSIRWLLTSFLADVEANQSQTLELRKNPTPFHNNNIEVNRNSTSISISTPQQEFIVQLNQLSWKTANPSTNSSGNTASIELTDAEGNLCHPQLDAEWTLIDNGPIYTTLQANGTWLQSNKQAFARFNCTLRFTNHSSTVSIDICLHNPERAQHSGGLWDLNDPCSIHFQSLAVVIQTDTNGEAELEINDGSSLINTTSGVPLKIYQDSSGHEHWNSKNHVNGENKRTTSFRGYQVHSAKHLKEKGNQASPIIRWKKNGVMIQAYLQHFWQNFPSSLAVAEQSLSINLFPSDSKYPHELQGGERKTQTCLIDYSNNDQALKWARSPITPTLESKHYEHSQAFPWFTAKATKDQLDELINAGLNSDNNFFAKRETIDEFGWRNFGEIFADHETLYQPENEACFISHYNNQYDAIYGFARQFALSGDTRWFELMGDLALHVADIDIYHTDQDRAEYNHGLFWHTDHYLDAHAATHRTYSRHNETSSIPGQTGGGPASEHCYTTGLLYHHFMTGNQASRQSVLDLANWMVANHEGNGGLLEQMLAIKKHELPKLITKIRGKKPSSHSYPFTRGTGNYINAILDAWILTSDNNWLNRAEKIIKSTLHPNDDISQRNLLNVEITWSYLILLTSIQKYLYLKQEAEQLDDNYQYALSAFCHYSRWIADNEKPFMSTPDQLEFPNDTWTAQDIRKAMLLFQAAHFDPQLATLYLSKAEEWLTYVTNKLAHSPEAEYARIIIILMQNYGPQNACPAASTTMATTPIDFTKLPPPQLTWSTLLKRIAKRLVNGCASFNFKKERNWLNTRLDK